MRHELAANNSPLILSFLALLLLFVVCLSNAADTLSAGQVLEDWQILESRNKIFRFGFFNPVYSSNHYLAIQFVDFRESKIVWVANRKNPLKDTSGSLNITREGYLVISDRNGFSFSVNPGQPATLSNTSLTLLDSGNLVLKSDQQVVWQSFDYPTDILLAGMKIGLFDSKNKSQSREQFLTSWLGPGVPSAGAFTFGVDLNNTKKLEIRRRGQPYWLSPTWNGINQNDFFFQSWNVDVAKFLKFSYTSNENESYFSYSLFESNYSWIEVNSTGDIRFYVGGPGWGHYGSAVECDSNDESLSKGCIEEKKSNCSSGDEFMLVFGYMSEWAGYDNVTVGLNDCEEECRNDCSCMAYKSFSPGGTGCMTSNGHRNYFSNPDLYGSIYVRIPKKKSHQKVIIMGLVVSFGLLGISCLLCYFLWKRRLSIGKKERRNKVGRDTQKFLAELGSSIAAMDESNAHNSIMKNNLDHELPLFGFSTIETATEQFSEANKLGQGGFGPVFKGMMVDGKEIAVKRLSERSSQGTEEFKNEVVLISKVQHRNLVRLYGCCIKGEEKLLIYEYLPNKSLDFFLFDEAKRLLLDWKLRMKIIEGIAQGLLYLHKYSRLKIIHRDLKTSNILLDTNMNPKISDFGTAKIFGENESRANTSRIVGTYGYMSPEYAMDGLFSVKSDVFSFGVMMLEIISGGRNTGFYQTNTSLNLTKHAWNLWKEENSLELMDPTLAGTYCPTFEFEKCVKIALLCVQENAADRPNMSDVLSMLIGSDACIIPEPKQSNLSGLRTGNPSDQLNSSCSSSVNGVTISTTYAR